jgi:hypothetical protein
VEKLVYLLWRNSSDDADDYRDRLIELCTPGFVKLGARGMTLYASDSDAQVRSPATGMTGRRPFDAELSLWLNDHAARAPFERELMRRSERIAAYLVTESLYTDYGQNRHAARRNWPDGARSPGVFTVTLLEKPTRFDHESWFRHWYGTQSPVSEAMQPRTRYVRNAVTRVLTADAPPYAGVVEEGWPTADHIRNPYLFYGADTLNALAANMRAMLRSVTGFLDLPRIQNVTTSEYILRSPDFEEI